MAAHFGYSLGVGAIPVKRFGYTDQRRDGAQGAEGDRAAERELEHFVAELPEAGGEDRGQAGGAHPELPDAAVAEAGALQRGELGPFRAGGGQLHALHVADPAVSGSDRAPVAGGVLDAARPDADEAGTAADRGGVLAIGAPRGRCRARAGGVEEGEVHGRARGRGVRRAGHQHHEVRAVRGAGRSVHRGAGADRHAAGRPLHLSRKCAQDRRPADAARIFHRRPSARDARSRGCQRAQAAVFDCGAGA